MRQLPEEGDEALSAATCIGRAVPAQNKHWLPKDVGNENLGEVQ